MTSATLLLDFTPYAVHAGIYRALAAGYYKANNIDLKVIQPTSAADVARLVDAGKADFGITDGVDLISGIGKGQDYKAFMALLQRPLAGLAVSGKSGITSPKQLEGKTVGSPGSPSNTAFLDTMVENSGGNPSKVKLITTGFNFVQYLESGNISAFTGYLTDAVQAQADGAPIRFLRLDQYGGPEYPSLVVYTTTSKLAHDAPLIRAFVDATVHGYNDTIADPNVGLQALLSQNTLLKAKEMAAELKVVGPLFKEGAPQYGQLNLTQLEALAAYLKQHKLLSQSIPADRIGTNAFLPKH